MVTPTAPTPVTLLDGLVFGEGPRWHAGALWFSDMHDRCVHRVTLTASGQPPTVIDDEVVVRLDEAPSGLGWLPDGSLLVVAMESGRLLRIRQRTGKGNGNADVTVHADASGIARGSLNDMIVRNDGTAFVGDMGSRIFAASPDHSQAGQTLRITPDGQVSCAADDLGSPNGHVLSPDESTLYVAESSQGRITAFDVSAAGQLAGRRQFAALDPAEGLPIAPPDGICLDADGAIWAADPIGRRVLRFPAGGRGASEALTFDGGVPVAVVLGGADRRTLLVCVADDWRRDVVMARRSGRIMAVAVQVPGAGKP